MKETGPPLGIVSGMQAFEDASGIFVHFSFGRVIDALAEHHSEILLSLPTRSGTRSETFDYRISAPNVTLVPQPHYASMARAMPRIVGIAAAYGAVCRRCKSLLIRGMVPFSGILYLLAKRHNLRPCHWIIGDPIALLKSHRRGSLLGRALGIGYAYLDRVTARIGRRLANGSFVCNGQALASSYRSRATFTAISSTLGDADFHLREDTCQAETIVILMLSFMRPEKGAQYLIESLQHLNTAKPCVLRLAGPSGRYLRYRQDLLALVSELSLEAKVKWEDRFVAHGAEMYQLFKESDMLVLPSLSEGTPRVLLEARANCLPVIASAVGGIPTSVTHMHDGVLVPPANAEALAGAISQLAEDGELRRALIANGLTTARKHTIGGFVARLESVMALPSVGANGARVRD